MFLKENSVEGRTSAPAFLHIPCMHFIKPVEYLFQYAIEYPIEYLIIYKGLCTENQEEAKF